MGQTAFIFEGPGGAESKAKALAQLVSVHSGQPVNPVLASFVAKLEHSLPMETSPGTVLKQGFALPDAHRYGPCGQLSQQAGRRGAVVRNALTAIMGPVWVDHVDTPKICERPWWGYAGISLIGAVACLALGLTRKRHRRPLGQLQVATRPARAGQSGRPGS